MFWKITSKTSSGLIIVLVCLLFTLNDFDKVTNFIYFVIAIFSAIIILAIFQEFAKERIRLNTPLNLERISSQYLYKSGYKGGIL